MKARVLLVTLALIGCTRGETPPPATPSASPPPNRISAPELPDPADPRRAWTRDLSSPRLSRIASLTWTCPEDESALVIDLKALGVSCEDFLKTNFAPVASVKAKGARAKAGPASCGPDGQARVVLREKDCAKDEIQAQLNRLRLPVGSGLYQGSQNKVMLPKTAGLPELEFSNEPTAGARHLGSPDFKTWLPAAFSKGAIVLVLVPVHGAYSANLLSALSRSAAAFLGRIRPPKHFRPNVEFTEDSVAPVNASTPIPSVVPAKTSEDAKPPLLNLSTSHSDPLLQQSCLYVSQWIRARQLLAPEGEVQSSRELALRCSFVWAEDFDAAPEGQIAIARLPLPLITEEGAMPFKSIDEALSPSLIQSLRPSR